MARYVKFGQIKDIPTNYAGNVVYKSTITNMATCESWRFCSIPLIAIIMLTNVSNTNSNSTRI